VGETKRVEIAVDDDWANKELDLDNVAPITPAMYRAGVAALARWSYDDQEPEAAVAKIWHAMCLAQQNPTQFE